MQDLTICPSCRLWKESLRVMPCCNYKFCDDCMWRTGGCVKCNNRLDYTLLRIYKPIDVLIRECLGSCKYCGELHSSFMLKSHESSCSKAPVSELVKEMAEELPPNIPKEKLTEQDMTNFYVQKNLMSTYQQMMNKYETNNGDFINHVISDTDTLSGIALRYGVTMDELRKANKLVGNTDQQIFKLMILRVPVKSSQTQYNAGIDEAGYKILQRRMTSRFARQADCTMDEAKYYLESHHFNFENALAEYQKDAKVPMPTPPAVISTFIPSSTSTHRPVSKPKRRGCCLSLA